MTTQERMAILKPDHSALPEVLPLKTLPLLKLHPRLSKGVKGRSWSMFFSTNLSFRPTVRTRKCRETKPGMISLKSREEEYHAAILKDLERTKAAKHPQDFVERL